MEPWPEDWPEEFPESVAGRPLMTIAREIAAVLGVPASTTAIAILTVMAAAVGGRAGTIRSGRFESLSLFFLLEAPRNGPLIQMLNWLARPLVRHADYLEACANAVGVAELAEYTDRIGERLCECAELGYEVDILRPWIRAWMALRAMLRHLIVVNTLPMARGWEFVQKVSFDRGIFSPPSVGLRLWHLIEDPFSAHRIFECWSRIAAGEKTSDQRSGGQFVVLWGVGPADFQAVRRLCFSSERRSLFPGFILPWISSYSEGPPLIQKRQLSREWQDLVGDLLREREQEAPRIWVLPPALEAPLRHLESQAESIGIYNPARLSATAVRFAHLFKIIEEKRGGEPIEGILIGRAIHLVKWLARVEEAGKFRPLQKPLDEEEERRLTSPGPKNMGDAILYTMLKERERRQQQESTHETQ